MSPRRHRTTVTIAYDTESVARAVARSLAQEVGELDDDRSTTRLVRDGRQLDLSIDATDLTALRATVNTGLSLVTVAEDVAETVDF